MKNLSMTIQEFKWEYSDIINDSRIHALTSPPPFEEIADRINEEMKILCGHKDDLINHSEDGYYRFIYCIEVSKPLFDIFFNSINGYRAWYFRSANDGLTKNTYMIQKLIPKFISSEYLNNVPTEKIIKSLLLPSAKIWLAEKGKEICDKCLGEWAHPQDDKTDIYNGRWEKVRDIKGRKAPYLNKIRIIGGFMNDEGIEFIPKDKLARSEDITEKGWA